MVTAGNLRERSDLEIQKAGSCQEELVQATVQQNHAAPSYQFLMLRKWGELLLTITLLKGTFMV